MLKRLDWIGQIEKCKMSRCISQLQKFYDDVFLTLHNVRIISHLSKVKALFQERIPG
jgi:hypothetical protein